ncbi:pyridoxamine 5'-phosphate oxidase [Owenweeksia hongkongensis]|uniref:pyridoxamine 5'-phosphate oxidase n=1 Tax=Owenweeksia hongkongensis TaxID=253245 RepID=UPI003A8D74E8
MSKELQNTRKDYTQSVLDEHHVSNNPVEQFAVWYSEYVTTQAIDPNAMTLSTINSAGKPTSRIVLLKGITKSGFEFYTNYDSNKGKEMENNPWVCLNFFWPELERQVRIEGKVEKVSAEESDAYFNSRPLGSRVGAWASPQSQVIESRDVLEERVRKYALEMTEDVTRPPHWGGYRVIPNLMEFWQGRASRLHDRLLYTLQENGQWKIDRLAP